MPGFNGTGPQGMGPGTGGRRGSCFAGVTPSGRPDDLRGAGRGYTSRGGGRGRAFGGGRGYGLADRRSPEETMQNLENRAAALEQELAEVRSRISAFEVRNG